MQILDDNPTTEDRLGFTKTAEALFQVITNATGAKMLPLTIGVFGGWGSGKTSLMNMVRERLRGAEVKTVWFKAWKYDGKEVIWNALLQTIFYEMKKDAEAGGEAGKAFREKVIRMAKALAKYSAKVGTRFVPGGIVQEKDVDAVLELFASSADDALFETVNRFEVDFDALTTEYVGERGYLVVFIDDLDRCLPENAIQVMEHSSSISIRRIVFLWWEPNPPLWRKRSGGAMPTILRSRLRHTWRRSSRYRLSFRESGRGMRYFCEPPAVRFPGEDEEMERLVRVGTRRNPRRVKRFLNAFEITSHNAGPLSIEDQRGLAKVLLTQLCFPDFYRRLTITPGLFKQLSGADERVWINSGLGELYKDHELRQFLESTRETCPRAREVRRWIRVSDVESDLENALSNGDAAQ